MVLALGNVRPSVLEAPGGPVTFIRGNEIIDRLARYSEEIMRERLAEAAARKRTTSSSIPKSLPVASSDQTLAHTRGGCYS
jgi:hypothetical protein